MAEEKVKRICDELKVSEGEAMFYLEGFDWKLDEAMQAFRTKTLPPVRAKSAPRIPVKSAAENSSATPSGVAPLQILSHEPPIQREQQQRLSRDQLVSEFIKLFPGASVKYAVDCLEASSWDGELAASSHMEKYDPTPPLVESQRHPGIDRSSNEGFQRGTILRSNLQRLRQSNLQGSSPGGSTSTAVHSPSQFQASDDNIAGSSSSMDTSFFQAGLIDVPVTASSQEEEIRMPNSAEQKFSEKAIDLFCENTGDNNRNEAINWLTVCNGDLHLAVDCYFEQDRPNPKPRYHTSEDYHSTMGQSSSMQHVEDVKPKPTEESGDDQNVTVAIPPMASSSQVDKGKAVADKEDSSAEMMIVDPQAEEAGGSITIRIILSSPEETVDMLFGPNDTLRDIRSAIAFRRLGDTRKYSLMSPTSSEVFVDVNVTVSHLVSRDATTLIQVDSD